MNSGEHSPLFEGRLQQPRKTPRGGWRRRALFQAHLWSGIGLGLYIFMISVTGSILVYRNELFMAATPAPIVSRGPGPRLDEAQLAEAALRAYPDFRVIRITHALDKDQAVDITLRRGSHEIKRLFDARSGADVGNAIQTGVVLVAKLMELHDDLLGGPQGRRINGIGAVALLVLAATGFTIWWPAAKNWRRSVTLRRGVGWRRVVWDLHNVIGFWSLAFVLVFGVSGIYLCYPEEFQAFVDRLDPPTPATAGFRVIDSVIYWLAFLHFGRVNGIGIPCSGPGVCDQATKAVWAIFGLAPAAMFATGAIMWWNRVLRPRLSRSR